MMSRSTYKGCKIEFYRDECDVPLPARTFVPKTIVPEPAKKKGTVTNRFDLLNLNGSDGSSNEENRTPPDDDSDVDTIDVTRNMGVNLRFLDSDST